MSEHALQVAVAHMLQLVLDPEKTWFTGIDHAAKLGVKVNKKTGRHYSPQGQSRRHRGVKRGLPDFIILAEFPLPHMHRIIGIELKTDKGKLSSPQIEVAKAWAKLGHSVYVARSLAEVQEILDLCHIPMIRRMTLFLEPDHDRRPARAARSWHPGTRRGRRKSKSFVSVV